ncbi:AAA family ATPase [Cupriavidus sp. 30B13]|uniref:AAA family ATPase n=1 Tax=Cupriavidus sp. 30B13 TaxID=3384241 RepID=UPI003B8FF643
MMLRRRPSRYSRMPTDLAPVVRLWLLRLLVPLGGHQEFIRRGGFSNDTLAELLGLDMWLDPQQDDFDPRAVRAALRRQFTEAEAQCRDTGLPACLDGNIARLAELVGLSGTDCQILAFAAMLKNERLLDDAADLLGQLSSAKIPRVLATLLDLPDAEVRAALGTQGVLAQSGLLLVERGHSSTLGSKLELLSDRFADHIVSGDADPIALLRDTVVPAAPAELGLGDYTHLGETLAVLRSYLRHALASGRKGVNIFVHGAPGTGKSQLARTLAADLGSELFEVASEDEDGDPIDGEHRLRAFRAAQSFFAQRRTLILFDEVEDIFDDGEMPFGRKSTAQSRKAWVNRMLEANPVPTVWLSNSGGLDAAFIRRFDMVFELPVPPRSHRARIIGQACAGLLDARAVADLAEAQTLAPAVVTRAASVVRAIHADLGEQGATRAMTLLIGNTLEAQGHAPLTRAAADRLPPIYDPAFVSADADLGELRAGLARAGTGRLCLYGPPGTGKTAYGRWLAAEMNVPLHVRRASDLMSKWVGENEQNIANAFRHAAQDGAVLLIDEVDSFLQDRRGARSSWEVTLVNEMLTQMESFPGVFVASTNLADGLDQAALRRFDLKVKFDFLKPAQAWALLCRQCSVLALPAPDESLRPRLYGLATLTPGDFAAVARQHRFRPLAGAAALVDALAAECAMKAGAKHVLGFL